MQTRNQRLRFQALFGLVAAATISSAAPGTDPQLSGAASDSQREAVEGLVRESIDEDTRVCDFRFADLKGNGVQELVVSLDFSGRDFCNRVAILSLEGNGYQKLVWPAWNVRSLEGVLRDLDGDGIPELAVPEPLSDYEGARCMATWTRIYRWDGGAYADASRSFRRVYDQRREELDDRIRGIEGDPNLPASEIEESSSCRYMERDAIERFLGLRANAGFERAQRWMESVDPALRRKAAIVFGEINDPASQGRLRVLAADRDATVAAAARGQMREQR